MSALDRLADLSLSAAPNRIRRFMPSRVRRALGYARDSFEALLLWKLLPLLPGSVPKFRRPCVVLGSSPNPRLARLRDFDLVCVNSSGCVARDMGLPQPALTVLGGFKLVKASKEEDRQAMRGLRTAYLLLVRYERPLAETRQSLERLDYEYDKLVTIGDRHREHLIRKVTTCKPISSYSALTIPPTRDQAPWNVSNGIFAVCFALANGAPEVILTGISLTLNGHYYSARDRRRKHRTQDRAALIALRERGWPVKTSEPDLSGLTGLPLT